MKNKISNLDSEDNSLLNLFDPENPDIKLFDLMDSELIKLSGSRILYYKYYESQDHDDVYMENRNKSIAKQPISVYGHYDPKAIEEGLGKFGLIQESEQLFTFNKAYIIRRLGRMPVSGDVIKPLFQNIKFRIYEVQEDSFESYGVYHLVCSAKLLRDSDEVVDENLKQTSDDIGNKLND
jgi:hypothetical protein